MSRLVEALEKEEVPWCMIGGLAVNHWSAEPMATADVDVVIVADRIEDSVKILEKAGFAAERFDWSINLKGQSKVSVQISTADFYRDFPSRSVPADVHGILMRVASREDTLSGKIAAFSDSKRRASKRQKDLADIARLLEAHPDLIAAVPAAIRARLEE